MADAEIEPAASPAAAAAADPKESKKAKKASSKREKPDDAVKLGCGGLFRRKKKSSKKVNEGGGENGAQADTGDRAVASKAPIEKPTAAVKPAKSDPAKGTVKIETEAKQQEEPRTTNQSPSPAVPPPRPPASPRMQLARLAAGGGGGDEGGAGAATLQPIGDGPSSSTQQSTAIHNDDQTSSKGSLKASDLPVGSPATGADVLLEGVDSPGPSSQHPETDFSSPEVALDTEKPASRQRRGDSSISRSSKNSSESGGSSQEQEPHHDKNASSVTPDANPEKEEEASGSKKSSSESSSEEAGSAKFDDPPTLEGSLPVDDDPGAEQSTSEADGKPDDEANEDDQLELPPLPPPEISSIPRVFIEDGPQSVGSELTGWQKVVTHSMVGTGTFKRAAACSLATGSVLGRCPSEFTPSVEQVAALRDNFENRSVFSAAGFGVADTVFSLQEETATPEILCGVDSGQTEGVLVARSNTALIIGTFTEKLDEARDNLGEMARQLASQGL